MGKFLGREARRRFWAGIRMGLRYEDAAVLAGASRSWGFAVLRDAGGVNPMPVAAPVGRYLSQQERQELMALHSAGEPVAAIAQRLGRDRSTIYRELERGSTSRGYRLSVGQGRADAARTGPRARKLTTNLPLRREVSRRLRNGDSPDQISGRLKRDFPEDPEMRVAPETIYQALYLQARGGLKRELVKHLRTGRSMRKPHRREAERRGRIPGMVMISERPAEVDDRAVAGHWEGDLIEGSRQSNSAVATLVERTSGFVVLVHLPEGKSALAVQEALVAKITTIPELLRKTLTWDQGKELMNHVAIAKATDVKIYFCDPHSPWQRPSNENTNGLLRQYLPKGTDLSFHGPGLLDNIAGQLNNRPRKRLDYRTPAEVFHELLLTAQANNDVA